MLEQGAPQGIQSKVALKIKLEPPDKRKRDIDNCCKALLDALTYSGVWIDDSQVDDLHIYRADPIPNGRVTIEIWRMD